MKLRRNADTSFKLRGMEEFLDFAILRILRRHANTFL